MGTQEQERAEQPPFPLLPLERMDPEAQALAGWWRERVSPDTGVLELLGHNPQALKGYVQYIRAFLEESSLEPALIGLVWAKLARLLAPEAESPTPLAPVGKVAKLDDYWDSDLSPREKQALFFAEMLAVAPHGLSSRDMDDLRQHFTEGQIVELGLLTSALYGTERLRAAMRVPTYMLRHK